MLFDFSVKNLDDDSCIQMYVAIFLILSYFSSTLNLLVSNFVWGI